MGRNLPKTRVTWADPLPNYLDLVSYCAFEGENRLGAYLLAEKLDSSPALVFGWKLQGIHSYTPEAELEKLSEQMVRGLKDFPLSDSLTIRSLVRPDERHRQGYLDQLIESAPCDELRFFLYGEKARLQELGQLGLRVSKEDFLFVTYYSETEKEANDWIERGLFWIQSHILAHFGEANTYQQIQLERVFHAAAEAQAQWHSFFTNKLGLKVYPLSPEQMRDYAWQIFNPATSNTPPFPQLITYANGELKLEIASETCPSSLFTPGEIPTADRAWIYQPATGTYAAVLTFLDKPYGWSSIAAQLKYLFSLLESERLKHLEIVSQIWRSDSRLARLTMEKLIRQSLNREATARKNSNLDVVAGLNLAASIEAQSSLIQGDIPFQSGLAIIVHGENPQDLKHLCREVSNKFQAPAVVVREKEVAWEIWLQTLPLTRHRLLQGTMANRTLTYLNTEVLAFLPLITTVASSHKGVELIALDSKIPVYLNIFEYEGRHAGFFASSRSGKSVAIGSVLTTALSEGMPVVAIDYPGTSGRSTFTDYTKYLSVIGDYFDVREHSFNIFDRLNLSQIDSAKERRVRWQLQLGFLKETLVAMVLGSKGTGLDGRLETEVKTVISLAVNSFFQAEAIIERYQQAEAGGLGSRAWQLSPTLADFIGHCTPEHIRAQLPGDFVMSEEALASTLYFVKLQLSYWLQSEIGGAIAQPSTVKPDARLMVFALTALKEDESQIFALIAFTAAYSRSLESPRCLFFIDESPILIKFPAIAKIVASLFANGSKSGIRVVLSAQAPDQLAVDASTRGDILQNMHYRLLGRVESTAIDSCVRILGVPEEMVLSCTKFEPERAAGRTQWLFFDGNRYTLVNYYAPPVQLATLVNNTDEADVRSQLKADYPDDIFMALLLFAQVHRRAWQKGISIYESYQQWRKSNK